MPLPQPRVLQLDYHVRVKGPVLFCTSEQKDAYKVAKRESKDRVYEIFYNAFLEPAKHEHARNAHQMGLLLHIQGCECAGFRMDSPPRSASARPYNERPQSPT
jgi:hypothetical protein